jgi:GNAT superfamily N-acetyltransferase
MSVLFYRAEGAGEAAPRLPEEAEVRDWRPAEDGLPPRGSWRADNLAWWGLSALGAFAEPDFSEITIWRSGELLHRHLLSPRWARFPFMAAGDRQLGDVWTHPGWRRRGLARAALAETRRRLQPRDGALWYVADAANRPSANLAESLGFRLVGSGRRTHPLGIGLFGAYRMDPR